MNILSPRLLAVGVILSICVSTTHANIISTTGPIKRISAPASVLEGALESDTRIFVFTEKLAQTLANELAVNIISPGNYTGNASPNSFIRDGVTVHSYMVHADHVGTSGSRVFEGSIRFGQNILAIITDEMVLDSSDPIVGLPSVIYPTNMSRVKRGTLDNFDFGDTITYSSDRRKISFHMTNNGEDIEQFRVITYSPEPASGAMLMIGGFVLIRRR